MNVSPYHVILKAQEADGTEQIDMPDDIDGKVKPALEKFSHQSLVYTRCLMQTSSLKLTPKHLNAFGKGALRLVFKEEELFLFIKCFKFLTLFYTILCLNNSSKVTFENIVGNG